MTTSESRPDQPAISDRAAPTVFISYRVADTADDVAALASSLRDDLGSRSVFRDRDSLIAGQRWQEALDASIEDSDATLCVIGPDWPGEGDGDRRIDRADDPVRREILLAMEADASPIPVLVDLGAPPADLDDDVQALFEHHAVTTTRDDLRDPTSGPYQAILVGIWEALRRKLAGGVLVLTDVGDTVDVGALVDQLRDTKAVDARKLSRVASGVYLAPSRRFRRWARRVPDVIVLADGPPSATLSARLAAVANHPRLRDVALVGTGVAGALSVMAATGGETGALSLSAHTDPGGLAELGTTTTRKVAEHGIAGWKAAGVGTKVAASAVAAAAVTAGGVAAWPDDTDGAVAYGYLDVSMTGSQEIDEVREDIGIDPSALDDDQQLVAVDVAIDNTNDSIEWEFDTHELFFIRSEGELFDVAESQEVSLPPSRAVELVLPFVVPEQLDSGDAQLLVQEHARDPDRRGRPAWIGFDGSTSESLVERDLVEISPAQLDVTGCDDPDAVDIRLHWVRTGDEPGYLENGAPVWTDRVYGYWERLGVPRDGKQLVTIVGDAARYTICGDIGGIYYHAPLLIDADGTRREAVSWDSVRWNGWSDEPTRWMWTFEVDEELETFQFVIPDFDDMTFEASLEAG